MFIETLLDAFADDRFLRLQNYGDRWGIQWKPRPGANVAELFDDTLDRLCETFVAVLEVDCDEWIDGYYERKRLDSAREYARLAKMRANGASQQEILKQEQTALDAGFTGD